MTSAQVTIKKIAQADCDDSYDSVMVNKLY